MALLRFEQQSKSSSGITLSFLFPPLINLQEEGCRTSGPRSIYQQLLNNINNRRLDGLLWARLINAYPPAFYCNPQYAFLIGHTFRSYVLFFVCLFIYFNTHCYKNTSGLDEVWGCAVTWLVQMLGVPPLQQQRQRSIGSLPPASCHSANQPSNTHTHTQGAQRVQERQCVFNYN